jgi:hypothetical protein
VAAYEAVTVAAVVLLCLLTLGGLVVRRKVGVCRSIVPYLAAAAMADTLMALWPEQFYTQRFWIAKELVINVLRFGVALELAYRTFRAFPAAGASIRAVTLLVLALTLGIVFAGTADLHLVGDAPVLGPLISKVQPRILNGTIWLLSAIAALVLWYHLPVHPWHKAILTGLVAYLLAFSTSLSWIESQGWGVREYANQLQIGAFLLLLGYWAVAAWRRAEEPVRPAPVKAASERTPLHRAAG